MASIDEEGGDSGHKKDRESRRRKAFYPCGYDADGGPGFFADHFFIFTATMKSPTTMDLNMPKESDEKDETKIKTVGRPDDTVGQRRSCLLL